jgi:hypothetical protein
MSFRHLVAFFLIVSTLSGCTDASTDSVISSESSAGETIQISPSSDATIPQSPTPKLADYKVPESIDPAGRYLFYLHGKIIEDQGIPAISPDFGEYEYEAILQKLSEFDFVVISEQRPRNANVMDSARKVAEQIKALLSSGVHAGNITVVGASKGAGIAIYVSHLLESEETNFVIMGICHPDIVAELTRDQIFLYGNVLSIYDSIDEYAGSCQDLFSYSHGKGIARYDEVVLDIGTGHGILYEPLDDWILPAVKWANYDSE